MKCHTSYPGSGQCKDNRLPCEAAAEASITELGHRVFFILSALHLAVTLQGDRPQRVWWESGVATARWAAKWGCEPLRGGDRGAIGPKSAFAFKTQKSFLWVVGAVLLKEVELQGCRRYLEPWWRWGWRLGAQKAAPRFSGGSVVEEKESRSSRAFQPEQGFWQVSSQQNSVSQKVQQNVKYNTLLFYQEIQSFGGKTFPLFRWDQVILVQMLYIQMIRFSGAWSKFAL